MRADVRGESGPALERVGGLREADGELWCEGVRLAEIAAAFGTPSFVYSEATIRQRYASFAAAFDQVPCRVCFSAKANHNLSILRLMRELGAGLDVVSLGELYRARQAGFAGPEIVFGGVGKRVDELEAALSAAVLMINVESEGEVRRLDRLAARLGVRAPLAVRVNPGVEAGKHSFTQTGHYKTKFGVAWEAAVGLYQLISDLANVEAVGIDAHIGSQILSAEPYQRTLLRLDALLADLGGRGIKLEYLDIGGGFGVAYEGEEEIDLASVATVAAQVCSKFDLTCIVEPGRWLIAPAGLLLTRVQYVKKLGEQTYCVTDAGSNDFLRPSYYGARHPIEAVRRGAPAIVADVVGPVCETGDFLGRDCSLPEIHEDDLLAVLYAGAYGAVMSSNYNSRPRAAEVLVDGAVAHLVRRREEVPELFAGESIPAW